eukprot:464720-Pyramimonas_sp.AAC.1
MPNYISRTHADGGTGAVGGASHGATKHCTGWAKMPNWASGRMRTSAKWRSVELPMGPRNA